MIKKVTFNECPELFDDIIEFSIKTIQKHRRGSNFWRKDIIEFKEEYKKFFPDIENFNDYLGLWETNEVLWDSEYGFENEFSELTRVEGKEKTIVVIEYAKIE